MKNRFQTLLFVEELKIFRNPANYLFFGALTLVIPICLLATRFLSPAETPTNAYFSTLFCLQTLFTTLLPFMVLLSSASILSCEQSTGTIRNILACGYTKNQVLLAKLIAQLSTIAILILWAVFVTATFSLIFFGFSPHSLEATAFTSQGHFWITIIIALGFYFLVLAAISSFGLLISTIVINHHQTIICTIIIFVLIEGIKNILRIEKFICTTYLEKPLTIPSNLLENFPTSWTPQIYPLFTVSIFWILLCLAVSFIRMRSLEYK